MHLRNCLPFANILFYGANFIDSEEKQVIVSKTTKRAVTTMTKVYATDVQVRVEIRRFVSRCQNAVDSSTAAILMLKK